LALQDYYNYEAVLENIIWEEIPISWEELHVHKKIKPSITQN